MSRYVESKSQNVCKIGVTFRFSKPASLMSSSNNSPYFRPRKGPEEKDKTFKTKLYLTAFDSSASTENENICVDIKTVKSDVQ